jgi:16S rRNA C967 or C1407 C5-methylase (RsmB/RsmF family)
LREGWAQVRPGGYFAYSVCSLIAEEGENRVREAIKNCSAPLKQWRLGPHISPGGDGFWAALYRKPI